MNMNKGMNLHKKLLFLQIFIFFVGLNLNAQVLNPVSWQTKILKTDKQDEYILEWKAAIKDGWSIYSQYLESDDGPIRTSFEFDNKDGFDFLGQNVESGDRKEGFDKLFDMNVIKFSHEAIFKQRIKLNERSKPITGYLTFMTCDDTRCLPPSDVDFEFPLPEKPSESKSSEPAPKESSPTGSIEIPVERDLGNDVIEKPQQSSIVSQGAKEVKTSEAEKTEVDIEEKQDSEKLLQPVKWKVKIDGVQEDNYTVVLEAEIQDGWHIYGQEINGDGPIPTTITVDKGKHYEELGAFEDIGDNGVEEFDPFFELTLTKFKKKAIFQQGIKVLDSGAYISGGVEYMTCDATRCLPPDYIPFVVDFDAKRTLMGKDADAFLEQNTSSIDNDGKANAIAASGIGKQNIENGIIDQKISKITETYENPVGDCGEEDTARNAGAFWTFVKGFAGGLIALLTPCVFPMIPLTVSYFTKSSKTRAEGIKNGLFYGFSIIIIYVVIGLIINSIFGPTALNELSTNWIANVLFFLIFIAFAISFFGYYEITLPSSWSNRSDQMADKGGLIGIFFMAATLAIVSFSCTGPIIGTAIVDAAKSTLGPAVVMLGFSIALALPFGLFAAFPALLNALPRSGSWMNTVKVVLGFLELALALKFLSVADMTMHWGILPYELFMFLWIVIFALMAAYLFGFIRFPHDSPMKKLSISRGVWGVAAAAMAIYLVTGLMLNDKTGLYESKALMSGLAPPAYYNMFLPEPIPDKTIKTKYPSFSKCANNLDCFKDYYEGVQYAKEVDKPVLLDFTGFGCVNCRKTEEHIWDKERVWSKINNDYVLISLYVDDRKKLEEVLISKHQDKKLRNIGNKWADFQIVNFQQNSQPLYVMMTPNQEVLAKPRGYVDDVNGYAEFLNCGLDIYKKRKSGSIGMK